MTDVRASFVQRYPVFTFAALAYAFTWSVQLPLLVSRRGWMPLEVSEHWEVLAAFGPFLAAVLVVHWLEGGAGLRRLLAGITHWRVGARAWFAGALTPFALLFGAVLVTRLTSGAWPDVAALDASTLATAGGWVALFLVSGLAQGLGEEPGWRGFMLPKLRERHGRLVATLLLWPVWFLWHLPAFLGRPEFGLAQFVAFGLGVLCAAIWLTWLMEFTGSLLMAVVWHLCINVARGIALAFSPQMFLTISTLVMVGAVIILVVWAVRARRGPQSAAI